MKRILSGSLEHLTPTSLLRLVSATSPSGVLELDTEQGALRLEVHRGRVAVPSRDDLVEAGRILACRVGRFRFLPGEIEPVEGDSISLSGFADAAGGAASDGALDRLLEVELLQPAQILEPAKINVLPSAPPDNPLDDLMTDLEIGPLEQLRAASIVVMSQDPRWWRGPLERQWQQRGWSLLHRRLADGADLEEVDVLVVHHQQPSSLVGQETAWIELLERAAAHDPPVPVIWIGPLNDPSWVDRLVGAGVAFLLPAPQGDVGEPMTRFANALSTVVDRQLSARPMSDGLPTGVADLVGALLSETEPDQGVSSLLQLAAEHFVRGAVLLAEEECLRCRAGFGFPLDRDHTSLERGIERLERVVGDGEAVTEIEPGTEEERRLSEVLGVDRLSPATALIPLGRSGAVAGLLVADREGAVLPDLADLVRLAGRLGGAVVR